MEDLTMTHPTTRSAPVPDQPAAGRLRRAWSVVASRSIANHPTTPVDRWHRPVPNARPATTPTTGRATTPVAPISRSAGPDRWADRVARSAPNHPTAHLNPATKSTGSDRLRYIPPVAALGTAFVMQVIAVTDTVGEKFAATLAGSPVPWLAAHNWVGYLAALFLGVAVASCFEGAAAYLMDLYDKHLLERDTVWVLRLAMLVYVGGSAAAIHWWTDHRGLPPVISWLLAGMSASALFLWSRGSRWRNRTAMRAAGQLDPALPKLPTAAKFWHPIRSLNTIRLVSWEPVATTAEARAVYDAWKEARTRTTTPHTPADPKPTTQTLTTPKRTVPTPTTTPTAVQPPTAGLQPTIEPATPTPVDPTAAAPTTRPQPRKAITARPTGRPTTPTVRLVHGPTALADAAFLRQRYGDDQSSPDFPGRNALLRLHGGNAGKWSAALKAHADRADQTRPVESGDAHNDDADDDAKDRSA
jgi:hypothetical protein